MPSHSNFTKPIRENLAYHGYDIIFINSSPEHYQKIKTPLMVNLLNFLYKYIKNKKNYKRDYKRIIYNQSIQNSIHEYMNNKFNYTIVIRPDLLTMTHLNQLKNLTSLNFIAYQWNGLHRFPDTFRSINLFDRFFVFDQNDLVHPDYNVYNLCGITNFYFDMHSPQPIVHEGCIAYFVGLHFEDRIEVLLKYAKALEQLNLCLNFNIRLLSKDKNQKSLYQGSKIKLIKQDIQYEENIYFLNQSDLLIDIVNPIHNGLSFRTFEAIYYKKKLVTNNSLIKNYDFYHQNNILVWDGENINDLSDFLARPYVEIDSKIIEKYGFKNWIKNILDIKPYQKISLPVL